MDSKIDEIKKMIALIGSAGYKDGSSTKKGWVYHPIPFPEFNPPTHKASTIDEYNTIINDHGPVKGKKILDIGCANGYFSFNFALNGADVIAYESDELVYNVNEEIRKFKNINNVCFFNKLFDLSVARLFKDKQFDIIIMLNIHMWIRKQIGEKNTSELMKMLRNKTKIMYFQTAHKGSGGGYQVPELKSKQDVEKYLQSCGFTNTKCLSKNEKWFNRYMFRCE